MNGGEVVYRDGVHIGCRYKVDEHGHCFTMNGKGELVERKWRCNSDGYPVVAACGVGKNGEKIYRNLCVHILVAHSFVDGWFEGAEVNHKDFNRANPNADNLEWVTHQENIAYSHNAGRYVGRFGSDNPNYGNDTLHKRYMQDKEFAKEKQSRPRGRNGRAKSCVLSSCFNGDSYRFDCQRDAVDMLISIGLFHEKIQKEVVIQKLKRDVGYKGWHLNVIEQ